MPRGPAIYGEVEPSRSREVILRRLEEIARAFGRVDIPDIPLGKPSIFSPVLSAHAFTGLGADVISHLRVQDHNILSIKSIIKTLVYIGVRRLLLLRGDPPAQGEPCGGTWSPEEAAEYAIGYGAEPGLLVSPRKSDEEIRERLESPARVLYVTRVSPTTLSRVLYVTSMILDSPGQKEAAWYIVLATGRSRSYLESHGIPYATLQVLPRLLDAAENAGVSRIILSAPGDGDFLFSRDLLSTLRSLGWL